MDLDSVSNWDCNVNLTTNITFNSSCSQPAMNLKSNPYDVFYKFAFGSAIYIIIVSFITIITNGLLLLVCFFDPLKVFRNATTYFLVGLAMVDILTAITHEPMYATCFIMMYIKHRDTANTCKTSFSVSQYISLVAMNCSFFIVLAFTITQYVVVISPLNYARKVTKTRVIICVLAIYVYAILFSLLPKMGVPIDVQIKIDSIFHSLFLTYLIIIFYFLLFVAFKRKMAVSRSLQEDKHTGVATQRVRPMGVERKFITVNFFLVFILFFCSQPLAMLWIVRLYSNEDPTSPNFLITSLMVENLLYLKFLLDPFVYAWRISKYRQALKILLLCGREGPEPRSKFSKRVRAEMSKSRDTVITLDFKTISQE